MEEIMTRKNYLDGKISFQDYYVSIAKDAGISFKSNQKFLTEVKLCLERNDVYLNTIKLSFWDRLSLAKANRYKIDRVLRERGDFWTLSNGVCTLKAIAAHEAMEENK